MSLKWLRQKLIKSKAVDPNLWFNPFDLKSDKTIPKTLRDSLISVESDRHQQVGDDQILEHDSEEETWEVASEYPDGCDQDGCLLKQASGSEIYIALKRDSSLSSVSLIQNVSSTSDNKTLGIDGTFLWITYLVPVRNESVIIHWKVKSIYGVRGFQVLVDGTLASTIHSSERRSELLQNVNMKNRHHFAVSIIPNELVMLVPNATLLEPATFFYNPQ